MDNQIRFPTEGSEGARALLWHVLDIASAHEARLHIRNVADTTERSTIRIGGEVIDILEREGEELVNAARNRATQRGVTSVTDVVQGEPYRTIVEYAEERETDRIVMPTQGRRGIDRFLLAVLPSESSGGRTSLC